MTLREKFKPKVSINTDGEAGRYAKECEQIADDYAIEFGNWLNNHVINTDGRHHNLCYNSRVSQLFPIFKKEKGL